MNTNEVPQGPLEAQGVSRSTVEAAGVSGDRALVDVQQSIGGLVEDRYLNSTTTALPKEDRARMIEYAASFEECSYSREELAAMDDKELTDAAYWAMADYARGQI